VKTPEFTCHMHAFEAEFTHDVRTGPETLHRIAKVNLDAVHMRGATMEIDLTLRLMRLTNPRANTVTQEPIVEYIPFDRVIRWEPLTATRKKLLGRAA
jgi:hypothetical protein